MATISYPTGPRAQDTLHSPYEFWGVWGGYVNHRLGGQSDPMHDMSPWINHVVSLSTPPPCVKVQWGRGGRNALGVVDHCRQPPNLCCLIMFV
jgi:hypothetical protein